MITRRDLSHAAMRAECLGNGDVEADAGAM
jgi:hypothetical protein